MAKLEVMLVAITFVTLKEALLSIEIKSAV